MTPAEYEVELEKVGDCQRAHRWSEESIRSYAWEHRACFGRQPDCVLLVGAGLAQDNRRHGVPSMNVMTPGSTLQELAYWRRSFIIQRRRWGHLKWHHPYQTAREQLKQKVKLP